MKGQTQISIIIVVLVVCAAVAGLLVVGYNGIVKTEKITEEAYSQIEVVCQRRLDLIPNLVETVKGYAEHEQSTLQAVIQARNQAKAVMEEVQASGGPTKENMAALAASQAQLTKGITGIFALVENYPNLRASANFMALQDQLEGTENRISVARQRYNQAVRVYNTKTAVFPTNIVASLFGYEEKGMYEAKAEAMEGVKVGF